MIDKKCDICPKSGAKTYDISLIDSEIDLKGKIDLCPICANKIKSVISKIEEELNGKSKVYKVRTSSR